MHGTLGDILGRNRPGPKRKSGSRYKCGKLKAVPRSLAERRAQGTQTWQRAKDEIVAMAMDPRFASEIGRMSLHEILTDGEAMTAAHIAAVIGRFERLTDAPKRSAASQAFMRGYNEQLDPYARGDQETVTSFERQVRRARKAHDEIMGRVAVDGGCEKVGLIDEACGRNVTATKRARDVIYDLCVNDRMVSEALHPGLKHVLGYVGQKLGFIRATLEKVAKAKAQTDDIGLIAAACVDAAERFVTSTGAEVESFVVGLSGGTELRSISMWAKPDRYGKVLRHSARVSAGDLPPALLDAALRNAALKKGWAERYVDRAALDARIAEARKAQEEVVADGQQAP